MQVYLKIHYAPEKDECAVTDGEIERLLGRKLVLDENLKQSCL